MSRKRRNLYFVLILLAVIVSGFIVMGLCIWQFMNEENMRLEITEQYMQMQKQSVRLIEAIKAFHEKNGQYPEDLNVLVPDYLTVIEKPVWGNEWDYTVYPEADKFVLYVENQQQNAHATYDSSIGFWARIVVD